ncbi:MAG: patatin-like phospholipase family protein [Sphingomonadaceae bacterium]|nr:patatin-like phospholipase family protein [Sphingomonadaceae bacterium]
MTGQAPIAASLILAGGLGLGAYQAGAYAAFADDGRIRFEAIAGSSIGAINVAIIAGNPPERAVERLRAFWQSVATQISPALPLDPFGLTDSGPLRHLRNWANTAAARLGGARGLFQPRLAGDSEMPSLYDTAPAAATLNEFIDFERLNGGPTRLCIATTDIETGEPVLFDTARGDRIAVEHLLASGALLPAFPAVRIGERLLGDGGLAVNAPLEPFLSSERQEPTPQRCFLIDLFALDGPAPRSIEAAAARAADLKFATQTAVRLTGLQRERALEAQLAPDRPGADLFWLSYHASPDETGPEKPYDFSRRTLGDRFAAGASDAAAALVLMEQLEASGPGLRVHPIRSDGVAPGAAQPLAEELSA